MKSPGLPWKSIYPSFVAPWLRASQRPRNTCRDSQSSCTRDLAYLIPFIPSQVMASEGIAGIMKRYHEALMGFGIEGYSLEELARDSIIATTEAMQVGLVTT